ncbi:DUF2306 domain-containing protein [Agromyces sp. H66]|uniref:DUF2306 domain-containing protein n=1 Tax=Agromyces sp. H66 TaxID=2529859 RepID=UPI0010AAF11C|nr:DUF2306 domain-containing protein [Agromyces sp. H66]
MSESSVTRPSPIARTARGRPANRKRAAWAVTGLLLLSLVPIVAGAARLTELASAAAITPGNARFFDAPVPVVLHIVGASVFSVLGAFQFVPSLRRRRWHRIAGRAVLPAGLIAALSGLWLSLSPALPAVDGEALLVLRLLFGTAMAASLVVAILAIRQGDVRAHSAWTTRAYAIGLGAGTQVFTHLPWLLLGGTPDEAGRAVAMGAGWVINLAVAEAVIRRRAAGSGPVAHRSRRSGALPARLS